MPDIFDHIFARYGRKVNEFYNITLLDPAYRVELPEQTVDVPGTQRGLLDLAEARGGPAARMQLELFLAEAEKKYDKGVFEFIWKPMVSVAELVDTELVRAGLELDMFSGFSSHLAKYVQDPLLHMLLKWPVIFIGASPDDAASMYSLMTYAGHIGGTWYPDGGLSAPALALGSIARDLGVQVLLDTDVKSLKFSPKDDAVTHVCAATATPAGAGREPAKCHAVDGVVAAADYHFVEQTLLPARLRRYDEDFWSQQVMSPSTMLYYLGFNRSLPALLHHTFYFDEDLDTHLANVFSAEPPNGTYAPKPTFYVSACSKTDATTKASEGGRGATEAGTETVFVLVPTHYKLNGSDDSAVREQVLDLVLQRMQTRIDAHCANVSSPTGPVSATEAECRGLDLQGSLVFTRSYGTREFEADHNSFRGNAFGLANTLMQSLVLKPTIDAKSPNMVFAGHLTNPGPGVPPSLVSGVVAAGVLDTKLHAHAAPAGAGGTAGQKGGKARALERLQALGAWVQGVTLGEWLCAFIALSVAVLWLVVPAIELLAAGLVRLCVPITAEAAPFNNGSIYDTLLRSRSYFICAELLYRHGRTYFCASTLMDARCFFDTGAMYALFRVADDYVDNDDERLRAAEINSTTGDINPDKFAAGARKRGALLETFIQAFFTCWKSALAAQAGKQAGTATQEGAAAAMTTQEMYDLHPVFPAVIESALRCGFGVDLFDRFFNAMRMDAREDTPLTAAEVAHAHEHSALLRTADPKAQGEYVYIGNVCRSRAEVFKYMDGSAAVIGDFMLPLLVPLPNRRDHADDAAYEAAEQAVLAHRAKALPHARNLGNAFQLTNFIRDIHEDTQIARQYIPTDICAKHGIYSMPTGETRERLQSGAGAGAGKIYMTMPLSYADNVDHATELYEHAGFVPMMEEMMALAEELYEDSDIGIALLPPKMSTVIAVARRTYSAMHGRIRGGDHKIYGKRFKVPFSGKIAAAASILTKPQVAHIVAVEMGSAGVLNCVAILRWFQSWGVRHFAALFALVAIMGVTAPASAPTAGASWMLWPTATSWLSLDAWIARGALPALRECSYAMFHVIFTIPAAALVWSLASGMIAAERARDTKAGQELAAVQSSCALWTAVLCAVATTYTLPWDDYLVANRVWWYGGDRVYEDLLVGHTPLEEVFFFSIQTIFLGGFWLLCFCCTDTSGLVPPTNLPLAEATSYLRTRRLGYVVLAAMQGLGLVLLHTDGGGLLGDQGTYGGLILSWCTPVLALQWAVGAEALINNKEFVGAVIGFSTLFLVAVDRWAIRRGIWAISEEKSVPMWISGFFLGPDMPIEEALFFVVTSCMCVMGLTLAVITSAETRRRSKASGASSFLAALAAVRDWGCSGAKCRDSIPTKSLARWKAGKSDEPEKPSRTGRVLFPVALFGLPLAAVAHKPVGVALAIFDGVSLVSTAALGMPPAAAAAQATAVVLGAMPVLRTVRLAQAAATVVVMALCMQTVERPSSWRKLLVLAAGNLLFANLDLATAAGTCAAVYAAHRVATSPKDSSSTGAAMREASVSTKA